MIDLFSVQYRPGLSQPPMSLLCQSVSVEGEQMMLWLDGINVDDPVMAPLSSMRSISYVGTFRDYAAANLEVARKVFDESSGEHAPSILARAIQYMVADPTLTANSAIELACDRALDIIEADQNSARLFTFSATSSPTATAHAG
jgi:hypothetical protein